MKHPKLVGADLYVARLSNIPLPKHPSTAPSLAEGSAVSTPLSSPTLSNSTVLTGSLHDELTSKVTLSNPALSTASSDGDDMPCLSALDSRPCYRCISYMESVGIKRVFWTDSEGRWEGAKVRDLVDMLQGTAPTGTGGSTADVAGLGVFVTKHEVLLLRRAMQHQAG
jgi:hypothetical protein